MLVDSTTNVSPTTPGTLATERRTTAAEDTTAGGLPPELTRAPSANGPAATTAKDQFLRLLVAQLQHQNPLTPEDGTTFIAQLAQFAAVEQGAEANARLGDIAAAQASALRAGYSNLVGKTVSARVEHVQLPEGADNLSIDLDAASKETEVVLVDENGKEVKTIRLGEREEGDVELLLDGETDSGLPLAEGRYEVRVRATSADGSAVGAYAILEDIVSSVSFAGAELHFKIAGLEITPADILEIAG